MKKRCIKCKRWFDDEEEYLNHACAKKEIAKAIKMGMSEDQAKIWGINSLENKLKVGKK